MQPSAADATQGATTADIEAGHSCSKCRCSLYLDAAAYALRCPRCDSAGARDGIHGAATIDDVGGRIRFVPHFYDSRVLDRLKAEVAWEQHEDLLPSGEVVL